jgi:hypothetical protein
VTKYGAIKTVLDGIKFDSKAEARRWAELRLLERAGQIKDLQRQVKLELVPGCKLHGEDRARPAIRLVVDFRYVERGQEVYEDTKGMETPASRMKRHMAKALLGVDVRVTA